MKKTLLLIVSIFGFILSPAQAKPLLPPEAHLVAERYGFSQADNMEQLVFTFSVKKGTFTLEREWHWDVVKNKVSVSTTRSDGTPLREEWDRSSQHSSWTEQQTQADRWFINDTYWLLFPFHLVWDNNVAISVKKQIPSPLSGQLRTQLIVNYASSTGVGYTPGDTYYLYMKPEGLIEAWSFQKGGTQAPAWTVSWDKAEQVGPFLFSTFHTDKAGTFNISIRNLSLKLKDRPGWLYPHP